MAQPSRARNVATVHRPRAIRLLRHTDPRITTEVYGHLDVEDMRAAVNKLSFGSPPIDVEDEQEALAALLLDEIASERLWDQAFTQSQNQIAKLADEAVTEFQEGRTVLLDEEQL